MKMDFILSQFGNLGLVIQAKYHGNPPHLVLRLVKTKGIDENFIDKSHLNHNISEFRKGLGYGR
jgi:hypothetical protein